MSIRYCSIWTMIGLQFRESLDEALLFALKQLAAEPESLVSITAAETLCRFNNKEHLYKLTEGLDSDNQYLMLMSARAFELIKNKPAADMEAGKQAWLRLKETTEGKWKGYDLYAYWSLSQVFGKN